MIAKAILIFLILVFSRILPAQEVDSARFVGVDGVPADLSQLSLEELMDVMIVSAAKREQSAREIPASVTVITKNEIDQYGYTSLKEILNQVPGLYLWDDYHVRGRINIGIRGFMSSDNVIILVNGVNQEEGVYNEFLLNKVAVPVKAIERIEVVKGPMSIMYGSGAFFGVINIITNEVNDKSKSIVSVMGGSHKTMGATAKAVIYDKRLRLTLTGSGSRTDGPDWQYTDMMSKPENLLSYGLDNNSGTKGILKDKHAFFSISGHYEKIEFDITNTMYERGGFLVTPPVEYSPGKRNSTNMMTSYTQEFSQNASLKAKLSYLSTNALSFYYMNEPNSYFSFGYNADAVEFELISQLKPWKNTEIITGYVYRNIIDATNPAELEGAWGIGFAKHLTRLSINDQMVSNALYTQVNYKIVDQFRIVAGLRAQQMRPYRFEASGGTAYISSGREHYEDNYSYTKVNLIPSLAIISPMGKSTIKLMYGKALRNPPFGQISDILFSTSTGTQKFPQLIPSEINTVELNYAYATGDLFSANFSLFYNAMNNLISQYFITLSDNTAIYYTSNKGKINTIGTEFSINVRPVKSFSLSLSGMYQNSENATKGLVKVDVPYNPDVTIYLKALYQITNNINLFVTGNYLDEMKADYDYSSNTRLGLETKPSMLLNGGISLHEFNRFPFEVTLKITNILDAEIHYPATTLNQFADKGLMEFPRSFYLEMNYQF